MNRALLLDRLDINKLRARSTVYIFILLENVSALTQGMPIWCRKLAGYQGYHQNCWFWPSPRDHFTTTLHWICLHTMVCVIDFQ